MRKEEGLTGPEKTLRILTKRFDGQSEHQVQKTWKDETKTSLRPVSDLDIRRMGLPFRSLSQKMTPEGLQFRRFSGSFSGSTRVVTTLTAYRDEISKALE